MSLTQFAIANAKPRDRSYKLPDGSGLHLLIQPNGSKLWRFRYRFAGKENMLALGAFPYVSLADARDKCDGAHKLLAQGIDPAQKRKDDKIAASIAAANTFGAIAKEYQAKLKGEGRSEATLEKVTWLLDDLGAALANRPIAQIKPAEILAILQRIEKSGRRETARRLRGTIGSVFRFAIATVRAEDDPTYALRGALSAPRVQHRPAVTDEHELGALARSIDEYDGWPTLRAALQVLLLTMARPGEVRHMAKPEIDLEKAVWRIPPTRTKMRRPHDVPLSKQAVAVLKEIWEVSGGELVFPSIRSHQKPLSENAMNSALRRMGYTKDEVTAHGFRASASTILNGRGFNPDVIEAALGHQDEDEIRRAYNRAKYWPERVALLQCWADLLDEFRQPVGKAA